MKITMNALVSVAGVAMLFLQGCASIPKSQALDDARNVYAQAEANADVQKYASVSLYDAKLALQKAEAAKQANDQLHLAYLAKRQSEIALATAQRKRIEASLESMTEQRDKLSIQLRGNEADRARLEAQAAEERARLASGRVKQLEDELADAKKTDRGLVLTLGDVVFESGKAELAPGAYRTIDKLTEFLRANPERRVAVEGHTDSVGDDAYNQALSQRRADAVAAAIVSRGTMSDRITARGFGEASPVANNDTAAGRQLNRRVEIVVLSPGKS